MSRPPVATSCPASFSCQKSRVASMSRPPVATNCPTSFSCQKKPCCSYVAPAGRDQLSRFLFMPEKAVLLVDLTIALDGVASFTSEPLRIRWTDVQSGVVSARLRWRCGVCGSIWVATGGRDLLSAHLCSISGSKQKNLRNLRMKCFGFEVVMVSSRSPSNHCAFDGQVCKMAL